MMDFRGRTALADTLLKKLKSAFRRNNSITFVRSTTIDSISSMRCTFNLPLALTILLLTVSCRHNYVIDGSIDLYGYDGENLYLVTYEGNGFSAVDSCSVRHGLFRMEGRTDSTVFAMLCHGFEPLMPLMLQPGKLRVSVSPSEMNVSGTRLNNQLYDFLDRKNDIDNRFEDILQRSQRHPAFADPDACYEDSLKELVNEAEDFIFDFISRHYSDEDGVAVFLMMCYGTMMSQEPSPLVTRIVEDAPKKFLNNYKVRNYLEAVGAL